MGIIKSSNLCTEIMEYSDSKETAVCNLASICLPSYISNGRFDFELLGQKTQELVHNLIILLISMIIPLKNLNFQI